MGILNDLEALNKLAIKHVGWENSEPILLSTTQMERVAAAARLRGQTLQEFMEEGYGVAMAARLLGGSPE